MTSPVVGQIPAGHRPDHAELFIVILPSSAASIRSAVKHVGDTVLGVQTQCLVSTMKFSNNYLLHNHYRRILRNW